MKAMIFAAGLGTRLSPLTNTIPKALARIGDRTLLEILLRKMISYGIRDIIINVHHFAFQVVDFIKENDSFGINIKISDESEMLLDTGGGIKKASWFFNSDESFLVHNVDVLSDIDFNKMNEFHRLSKAMVTLAVRERKTSRYLLFDESGVLSGWQNLKTGERIISRQNHTLFPYAFSGIHLINPSIFHQMNETGKFSIINAYLRIAENNICKAFHHEDGFWMDLGTLENLKEAENKYQDYL